MRIDGKDPRYVWSLGAEELNRAAEELRGHAVPLTPENARYTDYTESDSEAEATDDTAAARVTPAGEVATPVDDHFKKPHQTVDDDEAYQ